MNKFVKLTETQIKNPDEFILRIRQLYPSLELDLVPEKFPLVEAVGAASEHLYPPRVVILNKSKLPLSKHVLVGKGILYDSGGYALKSCVCMTDMFFDKTGATVVIDVCNRTGVPGIIFLTPNLIGSAGTTNGTIIKSLSGIPVEILNTDAEGRLGLADCLSYIKKHWTGKQTICVATLTGAAKQFSGTGNFALLTSTNKRLLENTVQEFNNNSSFKIFPAPALDKYKTSMHSKNKAAGLVNYNSSYPEAGSMTAHGFLRHFDDSTVLVDIAAMANDDGRNSLNWGPASIIRLLELMNKC